jgi:hypothetical protein
MRRRLFIARLLDGPPRRITYPRKPLSVSSLDYNAVCRSLENTFTWGAGRPIALYVVASRARENPRDFLGVPGRRWIIGSKPSAECKVVVRRGQTYFGDGVVLERRESDKGFPCEECSGAGMGTGNGNMSKSERGRDFSVRRNGCGEPGNIQTGCRHIRNWVL